MPTTTLVLDPSPARPDVVPVPRTAPDDLRPQTDLVPAEYAQLLLPKLTDDQLATLMAHGTTEPTSVGEVLSAAGDLTYDLMVVLEGEVEAFDTWAGQRRTIVTLRARDFIAELNLLTGQRVYVTCVVSRPGVILRVPRNAVTAVMDADGALGELLVQTMFRRREAFLLIGSGVQIVGSRYSPDTQRLREFAARNRLAYNWVDLDNDPAAPGLLRMLDIEPRQTPIVLVGGTTVLANPTNAGLAIAAGIAEEPRSGSVYDLLVVGAGPAGLAAAVYGATEGLTTAVVDALAPGGQAATTSRIENYLGFPAGVSGEEFGERALLQAQRLGARLFVPHAAVTMAHPDGHYLLTLDNGAELLGKSVIVATGVTYRRLDVPGLDRFEGVSVFYSPVDAQHIEPGTPVAIVGGGNSAGQAATALAARGHPVIIVVRGPALAETMSSYLLDRIAHEPLISVRTSSVVSAVEGDCDLKGVVIEDRETGAHIQLEARYLFVMIGAVPHTEWLAGTVARDPYGFILTGDEIPAAVLAEPSWTAAGRAAYFLETSAPGVFAVGDVRAGSVKRVAAAVGEGSMAVRLVQQYLGQVAV
jgi:thioredoxin reductase (NADPH)